MMKSAQLLVLSSALLFLLAGCGRSGQDSLARERASMESEAREMANHKGRPPEPGVERRGPDLVKTQPTGTKMPAGTAVGVILTQPLSTRTAATGDDWTGKLAADIKDPDGRILAKAGAEVKGRVVLVSNGSNVRRKHEIELRLARLQIANGEFIDIRTTTFVLEGPEQGKRPAVVESQKKIDFQLASATTFP